MYKLTSNFLMDHLTTIPLFPKVQSSPRHLFCKANIEQLLFFIHFPMIAVFEWSKLDLHGVYLCLIFEMSIWEFITNSKKKSISNQTWFFFEFKLDFYCLCSLQKSSLNSAKNRVCSKSIFSRVCNKLPNWHFKNQSQIDTVKEVVVRGGSPLSWWKAK